MGAFFEYVQKIRAELVVYYHNGPVPNVKIPRVTASVNWITEELIENCIKSRMKRERFQYFLDAGYSGLLVHKNGSWIAHGWIAKPGSADFPYQIPDWIGDLDLYWLFYGQTKEQYQNNGWHKYVIMERLRAIYEYDPDAAIFADTDADNISRFSMLSTGFEPIGKIIAYRFGYPPSHVKTIGCWDWEASHPPLPHSE